MQFLSALNLNQNELQNAVIQNLATAPSGTKEGLIYFNTTDRNYYGYANGAWGKLSAMSAYDIITALTGSGQTIQNDNLTTSAQDAISKRHTQNTDTTLTGSGPNTINNTGSGNIANFQASGTTKSSVDSTGAFTGNAATASKLAVSRTLAVSGDVTGSAPFDGSGNSTISTTLKNTGTAGTYTKVTTDAQGRVSSGTTLTASDIPTLTSGKISDFDAEVRMQRLDQMAAPMTYVSMNSQRITNLADPTSAQDAVTKNYADNLKAGLSLKDPVDYATAAALPSNTYSGGVITAAANAALTVDGITAAAGDRVLVKNESTAANNGIYTVTNPGGSTAKFVLTRASDFDGTGVTGEVTTGAMCWVDQGTANGGTRWVLTTTSAITIGTTALVFTKDFAGTDLIAGAGITKSGNTISLTSGVITTPGTYIKVNVDTYGRVTGSSSLLASDVTAALAYTPTKKITTTITGDGSKTSFSVSHGLGTLNLIVQVFDSGNNVVYPEIQAASTSAATIAFGTAPASGTTYTVVCIG